MTSWLRLISTPIDVIRSMSSWTIAGGNRKWGAMANIPPGISLVSKMVAWMPFSARK